jgi:hypothetical protein
MEQHLKNYTHSVSSELKKLMAQDAMCDSELRQKWEEEILC